MAGAGDDTELMGRYQAGQVAAFELLYTRHKGPLYRYFLRQLGNPAIAAELFQDVWLRIVKARERYEPKARFATWMYQIAHNCLVDHFRKEGRQWSAGDGEAPGTIDVVEQTGQFEDPAFASARWSLVDWEKSAADDTPGPEAIVSAAELGIRVRAALELLPPEQREAFLLHEEAGLGLAEISVVTGANPETVKSRLRYAVKKLRAKLGDLAADSAEGLRA